MRLRKRIAIAVLAAIFLATPALAIAAAACTACCCPQPRCHETSGDCEMTAVEAPCCAEAPAAVPTVAKRTVEAPDFQATSPARSVPANDAYRVRLPSRASDLARLASPLRLSVVLLI